MKSTHQANVVRIEKLIPHPYAQFLSLVQVGGYITVVRTEDFINEDKGIFIQPDSVVKTSRPEFAFLADRGNANKEGQYRIKVCKFRKIMSYGLMINAPADAKIGDDLAEYLEIEHYEPEEHLSLQGDSVKPPMGSWSKYDIESIRNRLNVFTNNEPVFVTEKIHGQFQRITYIDDRFHVGSRAQWKKEDEKSKFWSSFKKYPQIFDFCKHNPMFAVYGEGYGQVQKFTYGKEDVDFLAFDIRQPNGLFMDVEDFLMICDKYHIPHVPILVRSMAYQWTMIESMSNGPSMIPGADHIREGCVIKPLCERYDHTIGRVILKCVGSDYLLRS